MEVGGDLELLKEEKDKNEYATAIHSTLPVADTAVLSGRTDSNISALWR